LGFKQVLQLAIQLAVKLFEQLFSQQVAEKGLLYNKFYSQIDLVECEPMCVCVLFKGREDHWSARDLVLWFKLCGQQGPLVLAETEQEGLHVAVICAAYINLLLGSRGPLNLCGFI